MKSSEFHMEKALDLLGGSLFHMGWRLFHMKILPSLPF
jgi:hypothetical protein